ncbi:MAG: hypothetical protein A2V66_04105 [Ignavibacteria bacterium RBG_13_36_8]|nr:MAG: hypothetical protein A2V66_04105 [Ignavibacteria bacterium RBG_13_36_8]
MEIVLGQKLKWSRREKAFELNFDPVRFVLQYGKPYHILRMFRVLKNFETSALGFKNDITYFQNPDGGWPWQWKEGKPSGMLETAHALEILIKEGENKNSQLIKNAYDFIILHQKNDDGWSENKDLLHAVSNKSDLLNTKFSGPKITAVIVKSLIEAGYLNNIYVVKGIEFLHKTQNGDGGWSLHAGIDNPPASDLISTDEVLKVLLSLGEERKSEIILKLEGCVIKFRNQWKIPGNAGSVLSILSNLVYSTKSEEVRDVIQILIDSQKIDGGWSVMKKAPSDPGYTTYCIEQLGRHGVYYR